MPEQHHQLIPFGYYGTGWNPLTVAGSSDGWVLVTPGANPSNPEISSALEIVASDSNSSHDYGSLDFWPASLYQTTVFLFKLNDLNKSGSFLCFVCYDGDNNRGYAFSVTPQPDEWGSSTIKLVRVDSPTFGGITDLTSGYYTFDVNKWYGVYIATQTFEGVTYLTARIWNWTDSENVYGMPHLSTSDSTYLLPQYYYALGRVGDISAKCSWISINCCDETSSLPPLAPEIPPEEEDEVNITFPMGSYLLDTNPFTRAGEIDNWRIISEGAEPQIDDIKYALAITEDSYATGSHNYQLLDPFTSSYQDFIFLICITDITKSGTFLCLIGYDGTTNEGYAFRIDPSQNRIRISRVAATDWAFDLAYTNFTIVQDQWYVVRITAETIEGNTTLRAKFWEWSCDFINEEPSEWLMQISTSLYNTLPQYHIGLGRIGPVHAKCAWMSANTIEPATLPPNPFNHGNGLFQFPSFRIQGFVDVPYRINFVTNIIFGACPINVQFKNLSSGIISGFLWDFGDDSPSSNEENPLHEYTKAGYFNVSLTINTIDGDFTFIKEKFIIIVEGDHKINGIVTEDDLPVQRTIHFFDRELGFLEQNTQSGVDGSYEVHLKGDRDRIVIAFDDKDVLPTFNALLKDKVIPSPL